jgi:hypothetical protein
MISELNAQQNNIYKNSGICLVNNKTDKAKIIHIDSKVKYWLYDSYKAKKGRIIGIKDSSIIIKGAEIKLNDICKISIRRGSTGPFVIASVVTAFVGLTPIFIVAAIINNRNYDMTAKWHFIKSINPAFDSSKFKQFKKNENLQNDTSSSFSFTLNPLNCLLNQYTLDIGYKTKNKYYFGVGGGIVRANCWWNQNHWLYDGTDSDFQLGFYNGWLLAMDFKRLNINKSHWYLETGLFFKYLHYDHVHFINTFGDDDPDVEWIQSQIAKVCGIKFLMGKRIYLSTHYAFEPFFGVSLRLRNLSWITYWQNHPSDNVDNDPLGIMVHSNEILPGIQAGLLLTFGNFKKK